MKKISILLFAVMMAGSLSAQIESFSDEDTFVSEPVTPALNKLDYLKPHDGSLSPCGDGYDIYNIIGEQLFCIKDSKIESRYIDYRQNYYMLVKSNTYFALEKIQQGKYYTVKDILISKEDIDSLITLLNELPFISDTLYYSEGGKILDCSKPLPDNAMPYLIPKSTALYQLQPEEWPTRYEIVKSSDFKTRQAIYILIDDAGRECYIPWYANWTYYNYEGVKKLLTLKCDTTITTGKFIFKETRKINFQPGEFAELNAFIRVDVFTTAKKIFENQRIINHSFNDWSRSDNVYICKKIAFKDGQIMAAITDTASTSISYMPVRSVSREAFRRNQKNDSLTFLGIEGPSWFCKVHDLDSIEAKIAYEEKKAEQEARKKDARKKQELIKKYGAKIGESIANGKACVGMNKNQCKEAMGTPDGITKNTNNLGTVEVWTYSLGYQMFNGLIPVTVVTFVNDKVTSVKEYTSWP